MDCSLPGSSVRGIFQAKVLEWGAIAFSIWMHTAALFEKTGNTPKCPSVGEWLNQLHVHIKEYYLTIKKGTTDTQNNLNESPEIMLSEETSLKRLYTTWLHYITSGNDEIQLMENRNQTVSSPKEGGSGKVGVAVTGKPEGSLQWWRGISANILAALLHHRFARCYHWGKLYEICLCYFLQLHVNVQLSQNKMLN